MSFIALVNLGRKKIFCFGFVMQGESMRTENNTYKFTGKSGYSFDFLYIMILLFFFNFLYNKILFNSNVKFIFHLIYTI